MKKLIATIIAAALCISVSIAEKPNNEIGEELLSRGYPAEVISVMSDEDKNEIFRDKTLHFGGRNTITLDENGNVTSETFIASNGEIQYKNMVAPYSISKDMLSLSLTFNQSVYDDGEQEYLTGLLVTYDYKWLKNPDYTWEDTLAVGWDSALFYYKDDSFDAKAGYTFGNKYFTIADNYYPSNLGPSGIIWDAKLSETGFSAGWGRFRLYTNERLPSGSTKFYYSYSHMTPEWNGFGISFGLGGEITIEAGPGVESASKSTTYRW